MTDKELKEWCLEQIETKNHLVFPTEIFNQISADQAKMLAKELGHAHLMKLPEYEIRFFEWLKEKDPAIWDDLWNEPAEEPYIVGFSFLPLLVEKDGRGFPICDLVENENYYFSLSHMVDEESKMMVESSRERFRAKKAVTAAQLLTLEISVGPIDIWHFAFKHRIELSDAKDAVAQLVEDKVLVHLTDAAHIANFIEF